MIGLFLVAAPAFAEWPNIRGSNHDATSPETGLADTWPETGPPVLWIRDLGPGYAGFVVAGDRAFTLFQTNTGMFVIALNADTGVELWRTRVDWPWQPGGQYPGPYASPTWHSDRIYYATPAGQVGCVSATDGQRVWDVDVRARFGSRGTEFGFASTPVIGGGRVILPVGGPGASMVALSAADGSTLWAAGDDPASYCPAYPITLDGRRLVVGFLQNSIVLHDVATGTRVWRERLSSHYDEHSAWPLFDGRHLMIAAPFRAGAQLFRLTTTETEVTGKLVWSGRQLSNDVCSSLRVDSVVYGFDLHQAQASTHRPSRGVFKCLEFVTGKVRWETEEVGQASALSVDGKLVLWTENGTLILARANPDRYEELARAELLGGAGMCWAAPALSEKRLFVRDHQRAVCIYLGPPSDLDPARLIGTPLIPARGFDWSRLLPREPEFPNDEPRAIDVGMWFAGCVGVVGIAAVAAALIRARFSSRTSWRVFVVATFTLGAIGTTALGAWADTFVLTWPVSLYVAFRGVITVGQVGSKGGWRHRLIARLVLLLFAGLCYGYYRLCMAVGYAMAWGFLAGFLPAAPFAWAATHTHNRTLRCVVDTLGFTGYFWTSGLLPGWKAAWFG